MKDSLLKTHRIYREELFSMHSQICIIFHIYLCPSFSIKLMNPATFFNKETENKSSSAYHANFKLSLHKNIKYIWWEQAGKQVDLVTSTFQIKYRSWQKKKISVYLQLMTLLIIINQSTTFVNSRLGQLPTKDSGRTMFTIDIHLVFDFVHLILLIFI